ncbi:MAG: D-alanyl-D-alanine carboxypeptidase [Clostridiaceae bacterium]|nr:D-alanyl-D-alanine carboxypeptidase [Clostridiaceae bacterium]
MKRKIVAWLILTSLLLMLMPGQAVSGTEEENSTVSNAPFQINAKSACLMCANTGEFIFEMDSHAKRPIASITKIMTMLLVMEALGQNKITLDDVVVTSEHASSMGGSQVYLAVGEEFTVHDLLKAVAIHSANDASVALAEHVAGSEGVFVTMMNEKAKALGMNNTNFLDCSGLTDEGHYSTAHDIAIMSRELITKYPKIIEYTTIKRDTFRNGTFGLDNTNHLVGKYRGITGLKTGVTDAAGYCLAATASRDGLDLISVILASDSLTLRFKESEKILDYGFSNYEILKIERKGEIADYVNVKKGLEVSVPAVYEDNCEILLKRGQKDKITEEIRLTEHINAPVKAGDSAGEVVLLLDDKVIKSIPLVAVKEVEKAVLLKMFWRMTIHWFSLARR